MIPRAAYGVALALALLAAPLAAEAQQTQPIPGVGVLLPQLPQLHDPGYSALLEKLRELGYEDGRTIRLVMRSAEGKLDRLPVLAEELVRLKPAVIVAVNTPGTRAAINATREIPIVMAAVGDPVGTGFISNLSRPGGNVTGVSDAVGEIAAKRLQMLTVAVPAAKRIAVIFNPDDPVTAPQVRETERAARNLRLEIRFFPVRTQAALGSAFQELKTWRADAAMWLLGQHIAFMKTTIDLAAQRQVPTMVGFPQDVDAGGLISYSADIADVYRQAAVYVDKILKGAKPADLPVEQPTKFALVINMKTAKALGLTIPPSLLLRAEHVIE
jgi:putative tryptophan/tyrosine transport system substrate-binding protein